MKSNSKLGFFINSWFFYLKLAKEFASKFSARTYLRNTLYIIIVAWWKYFSEKTKSFPYFILVYIIYSTYISSLVIFIVFLFYMTLLLNDFSWFMFTVVLKCSARKFTKLVSLGFLLISSYSPHLAWYHCILTFLTVSPSKDYVFSSGVTYLYIVT